MAGFRSSLANRESRAAGYTEPRIRARPSYRDVAGVVVNSDTAIRMSTVYACVKLLSTTISSLPLGAYVRRGRVRLAYRNVYKENPGWIEQPNPETNMLELTEQIIASMELDGNAFILTVRDNYGDVVELWVLNPKAVTITRPAKGGRLTYKVKIQGQRDQFLTSDDVLHIPLFKLPGELYGLSPIGAARLTIGSAIAAETYAASYYGNAANPGGSIEVPGTLDAAQIKDMADGWNLDHAGPYNAGKIGVLTNGATFKTLALNAQDAQLLETQAFGVEQIARLFGVPLFLIGHPIAGAMSYASVEATNLAFVQHSLRGLIEKLERAFSALLPEKDGFVKFNLDALLRGTTSERYENYTKGLHEGWLSINDIKAREDEAPIGDAGDVYRVPLQNIDIEDAGDVGLDLRAKILATLVQSGFDPEASAKAAGFDPIKHTGIVPAKTASPQ